MPPPSYEVLANVLHSLSHQSANHLHGNRLLAFVRTNGLSVHRRLGDQLVSLLMEGYDAQNLQNLFQNPAIQEFCHRNVGLVNNLQCRDSPNALSLYKSIQNVDFPPNAIKHILKMSLKTCVCLKDVDQGLEIHSEIARMDFAENDAFFGNMLLDFYAKCGLLAIAHQVFSKLSVRDTVSWNTLISGLTDHGHGEDALKLYNQMIVENVSPDAATFSSCFKACGCIKATEDGCAFHAEAERKDVLNGNHVLGAALVDMYIKCGLLKRAQETFDRLALRDTIVWTSLIAGYNDVGQGDKALHCFKQMQHQGVSADDVAYVCALKACGKMQDLTEGQRIHMSIKKQGLFKENVGIGNALVDMYCRCSALDAAQHVFESMPAKDVVSWNTLITGYAEQEHGQQAITCFEEMQFAHVCPSAITFILSVQACGNVKAAEKGKELHSQIIKSGLLDLNIAIGSVLVGMYGDCGMLTEAHNVFSNLPFQNVFTWNALITGYVEHGHNERALSCWSRMKLDGVDPNIPTFVLGLRACGCLGDLEKGEMIHAEIKTREDLKRDLVIDSALVDMYAKCGCLIKAHQLFDRLHVRNVVAWTALIAGYAEYGLGQEALNLFEQMQLEGVIPNSVTLLSSLKACISVGVEESRQLLGIIARKTLLKDETFVGNALVAAYAKCGSLAEAQEVFESMRSRSVISWNALIAGYVEHDCEEAALECLSRMQLEGVAPDNVTYLCSLKACGKAGAIHMGQASHMEIERRGLLDCDISVGSALVDMYAKCGLLSKAEESLAKLPVRSIVSWNALISGYAQLGDSSNVSLFLNLMLRDGIKPDCITFVNILSVCKLTGMFDTSQTYFEMMTKEYGITPVLEHFNCLIDVLGRTGEVGEAEVMVHRMPMHPNVAVWHALLGACRKWGNARIGKQAFESAITLNKNDGAAYALVFDIYAGADK